MSSRGGRERGEGPGRGVHRPPVSDRDPPLPLGFSFPGLGVPGKVLAFESQESREAKAVVLGDQGACQGVAVGARDG